MRTLIHAIAMAILLVPTSHIAGQSSSSKNVDRLGTIAHGYDVVAYVIDRRAVPGSVSRAVDYGGVTYLFSTDDHARIFRCEPDRYTPAFNGYDASGVADGVWRDVDPLVFSLHHGELYLHATRTARTQWTDVMESRLATAQQRWREMSAVPDVHAPPDRPLSRNDCPH